MFTSAVMGAFLGLPQSAVCVAFEEEGEAAVANPIKTIYPRESTEVFARDAKSS